MPERTYRTEQIEVGWNSERCIHTGMCLAALPAVFDVRRRPWVDVDAATADEIAAAVEQCPSGALTYRRLDGAADEEVPETTTIIVWPSGPLRVRGKVEIVDARGDVFDSGPRVTLCRCGHSKNQPFCDLSHRDAEFRDNPHVIDRRRRGAAAPDELGS